MFGIFSQHKKSNHLTGGLRQRPPYDRKLLVSVPRAERRRQEKVPQVFDRRRSGSHPGPEVSQHHLPEGQRRQLPAGRTHLVRYY